MVKNKLLAILLCATMLLCSIAAAVPVSAGETYTVAQVQNLCDGIVAYKGYSGAQDFIDNSLCANAGTSAEFYVIALSQSGDYDFSGYERALLAYLDTHDVNSATSREKYALALAAAGSTDRYIEDTADEAIGELGIMSLIFGLHLLNNGYHSRLYSTDGLISEILSKEKSNGGWAVMGSWGDVDVTAMTIQALAPHYGTRGDLTDAVDRAIEMLSRKQLDSGGFKTMGAENSESAAQVVMALSALGLDAQYDGRFIKNGISVMAAMMSYRQSNGGFSHDGGGADETATEEAFCAMTAYLRMRYGQSSFYLLDHVDHSAPADQQGRSGGSGGSGGSGDSGGSGNSGGSGGSRQNNGYASGGDRVSDNNASGGGSGNAADSHAEYDSNGNRVIVINGQRFIESTNAAGEKVTVNINETQQNPQPTAENATAYGGSTPDASGDSASRDSTADENGKKGGYKPYAILAVILIAGGVCVVLYLLKKRNKKHYIAVGVIAAIGIVIILLTNFESTESYYEAEADDGEQTVTLSIRCDAIQGLEKKNDLIPDDGVILDTREFAISEGDTVYDVLLDATTTYRIVMDNSGSDGAAYIAGIGGLYEFDYGELSGWMYRVNGEFPNVGCQSYTVSDGDEIEWLYTTNIGKDLE